MHLIRWRSQGCGNNLVLLFICCAKRAQKQEQAGCVSQGKDVENIKRIKTLILKHDEEQEC